MKRKLMIKAAEKRATRMNMSVDASYLLSRYQRLKRAGICVVCADNPAVPQKTKCRACAKAHREAVAASRAKTQ